MAVQALFNRNIAFADGVFAPGAKATFFLSGTTTPVTVYTDEALMTPHPSPVVADATGAFPIVWGANGVNLKAVITESDGAAIDTYDPVVLGNITGSTADAIGFDPSVDNTATNVQDAIENNTAAILALGTGANTDVTDDDDLTVDPNNLGTRGNTVAYIAAQVLDEDDLSTDSATRPPSQQSTKAYVDVEVAAASRRIYYELEYTTSQAVLVPKDGLLEIFLVGGGGSGAAVRAGGGDGLSTGGGAGGLRHHLVEVSAGDTLTFTRGNGGASVSRSGAGSSNGNPGGSSTLTGPGGLSMTAGGGGAGRGGFAPGTVVGGDAGTSSGGGTGYDGQPGGDATGTDGSAIAVTGGGAFNFGGGDQVVAPDDTRSNVSDHTTLGGSSGVFPVLTAGRSGGIGRFVSASTASGGGGDPGCGGGGAVSEGDVANSGAGGNGFLILRLFLGL